MLESMPNYDRWKLASPPDGDDRENYDPDADDSFWCECGHLKESHPFGGCRFCACKVHYPKGR